MNVSARIVMYLAIALGSPGAVHAWCERHLSLDEELRESSVVLIGHVISDRETPDPPPSADPGHTYTLDVTEVLRGKAGKRIDVFTEYNSGQFPMDIGKSYLAFLFTRDGVNRISSCGNSGELREKANEVRLIRKLNRQRQNNDG